MFGVLDFVSVVDTQGYAPLWNKLFPGNPLTLNLRLVYIRSNLLLSIYCSSLGVNVGPMDCLNPWLFLHVSDHSCLTLALIIGYFSLWVGRKSSCLPLVSAVLACWSASSFPWIGCSGKLTLRFKMMVLWIRNRNRIWSNVLSGVASPRTYALYGAKQIGQDNHVIWFILTDPLQCFEYSY